MIYLTDSLKNALETAQQEVRVNVVQNTTPARSRDVKTNFTQPIATGNNAVPVVDVAATCFEIQSDKPYPLLRTGTSGVAGERIYRILTRTLQRWIGKAYEGVCLLECSPV